MSTLATHGDDKDSRGLAHRSRMRSGSFDSVSRIPPGLESHVHSDHARNPSLQSL